MKLNKTLAATLNIKEGEEISIFLLMCISFFMGTAVAFFYTASTAMFLAVYETRMLPYSYIASGVLGYFIWVFSSKLGKSLSLSNLLLAYMSFLTVSVLILSVGVHIGHFTWLPFVLFVWVRVFTYINAIVFWVLAGRIFDLRQGKRLFGLISAGEVVSTIIGFFSIPFLLKFIKVSDLITISLFGVLICFILLYITLKKFSGKFHTPAPAKQAQQVKKERITLSEVFRTKYLLRMFLLAILPMFAMYYVDFVFLFQTKIEYPDKNFIAGFLGIFFGFAAIAEFFIKVLLSGRLLSKYGIKLGLTVLPGTMLLSTFLASATGTLYGTAGIFYSFIAFTKFSERVLRSSLNDPSFQILYQPLPEQKRLEFQNQIEGIPKTVGNIMGGIVLVLFANLAFLNIVHYNYILLFSLVVWVKIAFDMYSEYRKSLKNVLKKSEKKEYKKLAEESETAVLFHDTVEAHPESADDIFSLFEKINPLKTESILLRLLMESDKNFNKKVLRQIEERCMISALPVLEYCLADENLAYMKEDILKAIELLTLNKDIPFERLEIMAKSLSADERNFAALVLGYSNRYNSMKLIKELIKDKDPEVKKTALISAGRIKRIELRSDIIECFTDRRYFNIAHSAIMNIGSPFLDELELYFNRAGTDKKYLSSIISIYGQAGGKKAIEYLRKKITYPEKDIREQVFTALSRLEYSAVSSEISHIKLVIEEEIALMVWIMAAIVDLGEVEEAALLRNSLEYELKIKKDYIFTLLTIIYDSSTLKLVRQNLQTGTLQAKSFALEIIDLLVSEDIKDSLLPLLEDTPPEECVNIFKDRYPQERLNYLDRLADIIHKDFSRINRWTKACAMAELGKFNAEKTMTVLTAFIDHADPLLKDTALRALCSLDKGRCDAAASRLRVSEDRLFELIELGHSSIYEKTLKLKRSSLFSGVNEVKIVPVAVSAHYSASAVNGAGKIAIDLITLHNIMLEDIETAKSVVTYLAAQNKFELKESV
jgi:ATP/ADP translocase